MPAYQPGQIPLGASLEDLKRWLATELPRITASQTAAVDKVQLQTLYAPPARYGDGTTVLADGTQWNPGAGQGVYTFYAGSWKKLG